MSTWTRAIHSSRLRTAAVALAVGLPALCTASGAGAGTVLESGVTYAGSLAANDDGSTAPVPLGFTANIWGASRGSAYVNNNGNITFDQSNATFTPSALNRVGRDIIAPFWADVDTRNGGTVQYGQTTVGGRTAFVTTWNDVGYFGGGDKRNSFQVVLVDRSDRHAGDFDIQMNYNQIQWETGNASGGNAGLGGSSARAGYSNADGTQSYEITGSAVPGAFLDNNAVTALIRQSNVSVPGRYVFEVRNGTVVLTSVEVDTRAASGVAQEASLAQVARQSERAVVAQTVRAIANRVSDALRGQMGARQRSADGGPAGLGLSAGDATGAGQLSGWADGSASFLRSFEPAAEFHGRSQTAMVGADYKLTEALVVGAAVGMEHNHFDLTTLNGRRTGNGLSVTPYVGYAINDYLTVDVSLSYGHGYNHTRQNLLGGMSTGRYASDRLIASTNLSGYLVEGAWTFRGVAGLSVARTRSDSYTDSAGAVVSPGVNDLRQWRLGAEAEYEVTPSVRPFAGATLEYDMLNRTTGSTGGALVTSGGTDRAGMVAAAGVRVSATDALNLTAQVTTQAFRANQRDTTIGLSARMAF
ncbi:nidogen-like domain-containing protein [Azospirillum endophyticum]